MPQILTNDIENIRNLTDERLEYALYWLYGVWDHSRKLSDEKDKAENNLNNVENMIKNDAESQLTTGGWAVRIIFGILGALYFFGLFFGDGSLFLAIIFFLISIFVPPYYKSDKEQKAFLENATERRKGELQAAKDAVQQAEANCRAFSNTPEMNLLNYFRQKEGGRLSQTELGELHGIVREGYANTFSEARKVLEQREHNRKMQRLEERRAEQEEEHYRRMEQAERERIDEQRRSNNEQRRTAEQIARDTRRAADAQEEHTRIAKEMYRDYTRYM